MTSISSQFATVPELRSLRLIAVRVMAEVGRNRSLEAGFERHFVEPVDFEALKAHLHRASLMSAPATRRSRPADRMIEGRSPAGGWPPDEHHDRVATGRPAGVVPSNH